MPEPAQIALGQPSPAAHDGRRLRRASSEKKAVRPPSGYPYDPSGYGACFGAKWRLPGRAGAGRCRLTPEQGWASIAEAAHRGRPGGDQAAMQRL